MRLGGRLDRLEREAVVGCPACEGGAVVYAVQFHEGPIDAPERCPRCGRDLVFRLNFDDAEVSR
ncbi:MAG: hypothetical protein GY716_06775 [bacterium]|nr:hypothetical protein [bacterium]